MSVDQYPWQTTDADGKKVCIVQAWQYGNVVGELDVNFDANGDVVSCAGRPIIPLAEPSSWVNAADRTPLSAGDRDAVMAALPAGAAVYAEDADAKAWIDANAAQIDTMKQERIATFENTFCLAREPGSSRSTICQVCEVYHRGGGACQLVAKAFLMGEKSADIAIQNGGGCRQDLAQGEYSVGQAYEMLPYSNTMVTLEMTGQQVRDVLEDALEMVFAGGNSGAYPYAAGLRFHVDASKAKGSRVSNLEVNPRLGGGGSCTWSPIGPAATYVVVTNSYIAGGKDGYVTFGKMPAEKLVNTYTNYAQGFIDYLTSVHGPIVPLHPAEYSTQGYINTNGCDHSTNGKCLAGSSCGAAHTASDSSMCENQGGRRGGGGRHTDDVALRANSYVRTVLTVPAARRPAGRKPLRRLLADCSRTPVCERLPRGWTRLTDAVSGCDYYWNTFTQTSTWDSPVCGPRRPPPEEAPTVPAPALPPPSPPLSATATPAPALPVSDTENATIGVAPPEKEEDSSGLNGTVSGEEEVAVEPLRQSLDCGFSCEGPCLAVCGDGMHVDVEGCDDANNVDGDGCR